MTGTGMSEIIMGRYDAGATLIGISAGAMHLGVTGDASAVRDRPSPSTGSLVLVRYVVGAHDEGRDWEELTRVIAVSDGRIRGLALPSGSAAIYHADHVLEPVSGTVMEFTAGDGVVTRTLLLPSCTSDSS